jgi:hypothetical protein
MAGESRQARYKCSISAGDKIGGQWTELRDEFAEKNLGRGAHGGPPVRRVFEETGVEHGEASDSDRGGGEEGEGF